MRIALFLILCLLVPLSVSSPPPASAEILAPGAYRGWVIRDRWGSVHLASGVYLLEFRGDTRKAALAWEGKSVTVDVTKIESVGFVGHAIAAIGSIKAVKPRHGDTLAIDLQEPEVCPPRPEHQEMDIYLRYTGKDRFRLQCKRIVVMLRRVGAEPPGGADRPQAAFVARDESGVPWRAGGSSWQRGGDPKQPRRQQLFRAVGGTFETQGAFTYHTTLNMQLPPGQYEFHAVYDEGNFSSAPAPRSRILRFDVPPK